MITEGRIETYKNSNKKFDDSWKKIEKNFGLFYNGGDPLYTGEDGTDNKNTTSISWGIDKKGPMMEIIKKIPSQKLWDSLIKTKKEYDFAGRAKEVDKYSFYLEFSFRTKKYTLLCGNDFKTEKRVELPQEFTNNPKVKLLTNELYNFKKAFRGTYSGLASKEELHDMEIQNEKDKEMKHYRVSSRADENTTYGWFFDNEGEKTKKINLEELKELAKRIPAIKNLKLKDKYDYVTDKIKISKDRYIALSETGIAAIKQISHFDY